MNDETPPKRGRSPLILGLILLLVGAALLAANLGFELPYQLWRYYPIALLALGLVGVVTPSRHLSRSGGIWLLAAGLYCLASEFRLLGLWWTNAWPIFLMAAGVDIIFSREWTSGFRGMHDR
jgi:cell wall-active antibiotic response 4TMS protein YvqF